MLSSDVEKMKGGCMEPVLKNVEAAAEKMTPKEMQALHNKNKEEIMKKLGTFFGEKMANEIYKRYEKITKEYWMKGKEGEYQPYRWRKSMIEPSAAIDFDEQKEKVRESLINEIAIMLANRTVVSIEGNPIKNFNQTYIPQKYLSYLLEESGSSTSPTLKYFADQYTDNMKYVAEVAKVAEDKQRAENKRFHVVYTTSKGEKKEGFLLFSGGLTYKEVAELTSKEAGKSKKFLTDPKYINTYELYSSSDCKPSSKIPGAHLAFKDAKEIEVTRIISIEIEEGEKIAANK